MKRTTTILFMLLSCKLSFSQDSNITLSVNDFLQIVKQFHPVAKQARLKEDMARAGVTIARSGFDPLLNINGGNKTFDGINYYQHQSGSLTIPTWYGIEINTGGEYLNGSRTDPQETTGKTSFAGVTVPLGKNLLMDKRRAALRQSKIMLQASEQEKIAMLNDLMMEAASAYWNWVQ